jgi:hypothetical protein
MLFIGVVAECRIMKRYTRSFIGELGITDGINSAVQERKKVKKRNKERERERERERESE